MAVSAGFIDSLVDMLRPLGLISIRKMFGGAAVYCDGQVFALLSDDELFLKVDGQTRPSFEAEGCGPFTYTTKDGTHVMAAYHRAPDRLLDEPDELIAWVRDAIAVGRRAAKPVTAKSGRVKAVKPSSTRKARTRRAAER